MQLFSTIIVLQCCVAIRLARDQLCKAQTNCKPESEAACRWPPFVPDTFLYQSNGKCSKKWLVAKNNSWYLDGLSVDKKNIYPFETLIISDKLLPDYHFLPWNLLFVSHFETLPQSYILIKKAINKVLRQRSVEVCDHNCHFYDQDLYPVTRY